MAVECKAFIEGCSAFENDVTDCPYSFKDSPEDYISWGEGWSKAFSDYVGGL